MTNPWTYILWITVLGTLLNSIGITAGYLHRERLSMAFLWSAVAVQGLFILWLWMALSHPPMRTMGDTRLWYTFFLYLSGAAVFTIYRFRWISIFTTVLGLVFNIINIARPELHTEPLQPVLQSAWFIPHVSIYMFSYAVLGCATLLMLINLYRHSPDRQQAANRLLRLGIALFGIGMLLGALWAKQAWGNYWNWDAKETWAAMAWTLYLTALHCDRKHTKTAAIVSLVAFMALQMCWWGIRYLPQAADSAHVYG